MIEDELIRIWQSSPNQERAKFEKSRLMLDVQSNLDRLDRQIKYRDLREQIAIVIVIPAFAYAAYSMPHLLTKIASLLIICWGVYVFFRLRNAKKHKPGAFTETYLEYLYQSRKYLNIQKQLLESVVYWYILPGITLTMLFVLGPGMQPGKSRIIVNMGIMNIVLAIVTYLLNKRAVKKQLMPRLEKVDGLIKVMEQS